MIHELDTELSLACHRQSLLCSAVEEYSHFRIQSVRGMQSLRPAAFDSAAGLLPFDLLATEFASPLIVE